jgi:hypothetical protein
MDLMKLAPTARNKAFNALPRNEKAVEVAKDVLRQLDAKLYKATSGIYFDFLRQDLDPYAEESLQAVLETEPCRLCAIGGTFASTARLRNNVATSTVIVPSSTFMMETMVDVFTEHTLRAMEVVFETYNARTYPFSREDSTTLIMYGRELQSKVDDGHADDYVMRTIMQNIIDNNGEFVVPGITLAAYEKDAN